MPDEIDEQSRSDAAEDLTAVATVIGPEPGFLAAISVGDVTRLLVASNDRVASDLKTQIEACSQPWTEEVLTRGADIARVVHVIDGWFAAENAAASAGLGGSALRRRRKITNRIDAAIASAPPHLRASRLVTAARARAIATAPQCGWVERELGELSRSDSEPDAWLAAVASLGARQAGGHDSDVLRGKLRIHALLIVRVKRRRSRSPRAPESP
jgi:hypothetical protein